MAAMPEPFVGAAANDTDAQETREWLDALSAVIGTEGGERAHFLLETLIDHARLAFEPACLRFHETDRAVRTASSEQVRRPIFREGVEQWHNFEPWLDPLKQALGTLIEEYPFKA